MAAGSATTLDARDFARLIASFDTNPSEAEAINACRALRRMVKKEGLRFVDVMEWPEVKAALDDQIQPVRQESAELAALRERLKRVATQDGAVKDREETIAGLRHEFATLQNILREMQAARNEPCFPCEKKRRWMALGAGGITAAAWFWLLSWVEAEAWQRACGIGLALAPLAGVYGRWQCRIFRRRHWPRLAARWNGTVQRAMRKLEAMSRRLIFEVRE